MPNNNLKSKLCGMFIIFLFAISLISAQNDVAYIFRKISNINGDMIEQFNSMGMDVELISENNLPKDLSSYKIIFLGNEEFRNINEIPKNRPLIIMGSYHGEDFGLTQDEVSQLISNHPMEVVTDNGIVQVYNEGSNNSFYYYLADEYKAENLTVIARAYDNNMDNLGDVISYKDKTCFFGIVNTQDWTPETRELFGQCTNVVEDEIACFNNNNCADDSVGNYCIDDQVFEEYQETVCINHGTIDSQCAKTDSYISKFVKSCEDGCKNGECINKNVSNSNSTTVSPSYNFGRLIVQNPRISIERANDSRILQDLDIKLKLEDGLTKEERQQIIREISDNIKDQLVVSGDLIGKKIVCEADVKSRKDYEFNCTPVDRRFSLDITDENKLIRNILNDTNRSVVFATLLNKSGNSSLDRVKEIRKNNLSIIEDVKVLREEVKTSREERREERQTLNNETEINNTSWQDKFAERRENMQNRTPALAELKEKIESNREERLNDSDRIFGERLIEKIKENRENESLNVSINSHPIISQIKDGIEERKEERQNKSFLSRLREKRNENSTTVNTFQNLFSTPNFDLIVPTRKSNQAELSNELYSDEQIQFNELSGNQLISNETSLENDLVQNPIDENNSTNVTEGNKTLVGRIRDNGILHRRNSSPMKKLVEMRYKLMLAQRIKNRNETTFRNIFNRNSNNSNECIEDIDCGIDFIGERYCDDSTIYNDFHEFKCIQNQCMELMTPEVDESCSDECLNEICSNSINLPENETDSDENNSTLIFDRFNSRIQGNLIIEKIHSRIQNNSRERNFTLTRLFNKTIPSNETANESGISLNDKWKLENPRISIERANDSRILQDLDIKLKLEDGLTSEERKDLVKEINSKIKQQLVVSGDLIGKRIECDGTIKNRKDYQLDCSPIDKKFLVFHITNENVSVKNAINNARPHVVVRTNASNQDESSLDRVKEIRKNNLSIIEDVKVLREEVKTSREERREERQTLNNETEINNTSWQDKFAERRENMQNRTPALAELKEKIESNREERLNDSDRIFGERLIGRTERKNNTNEDETSDDTIRTNIQQRREVRVISREETRNNLGPIRTALMNRNNNDSGTVQSCERDIDCDSTGYYTDRYCKGTELYKDKISYKCIENQCVKVMSPEFFKSCENNCLNGECLNS
ncbi:MAG: hypothetical protein ACOYT4_05465 [Nanoarchaeota archaeon]